MENLETPFRRYTMGKSPTHAVTEKIYEAFAGFNQQSMNAVLSSIGYLSDRGKPTKKALNDGVIDKCGTMALWNLNNLEQKLKKGIPSVKRRYSNQTLDLKGEDDTFSTLTVIASHFNVSSREIGKWLDKLNLRTDKGLPRKEVVKSGLAKIEDVKTVGNRSKQTRKSGFWKVRQTCELLMDAGHPLDFDYNKSLQGKGRNSDVVVQENAVEKRAKEFAKDFAARYNRRDPELKNIVPKTPKMILNRAEEILKKPGLFSRDLYLKRIS